MATDDQARVCADAGVAPWEIDPQAVVGLGRLDLVPLNGLRHRPSGESSGWYIWSGGEIPPDPDFFRPVHIRHLQQMAPQAMPFLALPPGWRFQVALDHEDVWADVQLLDPNQPTGGWTADDAVMADLRRWLVDRGFTVVRDHLDSGSFGNQEVILARPTAVRLVRDRDQWRVEVLGEGGEWTGIEGRRGPQSQPLSAADQADLLREILAETE